MKKMGFAAAFILIFVLLSASQGRRGYYRDPSLHGDKVIFTSESDLWIVPVTGGMARRLTSHPGMETDAAVSPDGALIAFTAQYEGPSEVYTMPVDGGLPKRCTFSGQTSTVVGWTPDGKIIYATQKYSTLPNTQLAVLDPIKGGETVVPLAQASDGTYDETLKNLFFTRLPFQGSYTKRYKGGTVQKLWKFTSGGAEAIPLTDDYPGTSKNPMFWQGRIYFLSDRDGIMNLWSMNDTGADLKQHTFHRDFDASSPSMHNGRIVYQSVADLYIYDIAAGSNTLIPVTLSSDFDQMRENWIKNPMEYLTSAHISPDGERVLLTSRGQVFSAPAKQGRLIRVTRKEGIRRRSARFLPGGKEVMFLSDESGEWEFYRQKADGTGDAEALTRGAKVIRFDGISSPDGKRIAFGDKDQQLWIHNIGENKTQMIASSPNGMYYDFSWSPDGNWLAFVEPADNQFDRIKVYDIARGRTITLTSDRVDSYNPVWSPDGKWIYFLSDRFFQSLVGSPWGPRQPEPYFSKTTKLYAAALVPGQRFPFAPNDELVPEKTNIQKKPAEKKSPEPLQVIIEENGLASRIFEVPIAPGNYRDLSINEKVLFFVSSEVDLTRSRALQALEIKSEKPEVKTVVERINDYELSRDGKKILVQKDRGFYVIDAMAAPAGKLAEGKVDLSHWVFSLDPKKEWKQMLVDAWRMERDYFYDRNMHNVDYEGLLKLHLPFIERISDRSELNDLIAHLVGELSALHTFVRGGDLRQSPDQVGSASLGARLERSENLGGYRIAYIYRSEPDYPDRYSPLARPWLGIAEGDVILSINGASLLETSDPGLLLRNTAGQQVLLEVKSPDTGKSRKLIVYPISVRDDANLRYDDWEFSRRMEVEKLGEGKIGYVHLRAMGGFNYTEWVKNFYPVFNRQGLIVDVRHNRGGNIDSWILEKLLRKAWFYWQGRVGNPTWNMQYAFRGHMVVLCNERTASDGEAFAEGFRRLGLGKVIGTRTWGGEIWLSSSNILVDRGLASAAETGVYGPDGIWLIEGHGVDPDIVVDNLPHATFMGRDAQLEAAVRHLQEKIAADPVEVPVHPPYPDKRKQ